MDKVYGDLVNIKYVLGYVCYDVMVCYNVNKNVDLQLNVNNLVDICYFIKVYLFYYVIEVEGCSVVLFLNFKY